MKIKYECPNELKKQNESAFRTTFISNMIILTIHVQVITENVRHKMY